MRLRSGGRLALCSDEGDLSRFGVDEDDTELSHKSCDFVSLLLLVVSLELYTME